MNSQQSLLDISYGKGGLMIAIVFLVILAVIAVVLIGMYNSLVQLRVRCDSA